MHISGIELSSVIPSLKKGLLKDWNVMRKYDSGSNNKGIKRENDTDKTWKGETSCRVLDNRSVSIQQMNADVIYKQWWIQKTPVIFFTGKEGSKIINQIHTKNIISTQYTVY